MTVHFFTKSPISMGSSRQRAYLICQELVKKGISAKVHEPSVMEISETRWPAKAGLLTRVIKILNSIKKEDIIVLQRTVYNKYFWLIIMTYKIIWRRRIYFDIDDAVYKHSFFKTKTLVWICDGVFAGSHALADWCKKYNSNVCIIPTGVDLEKYLKYRKKYPDSFGELTVGWVGGASYHYENLLLLAPVFKILIGKKINFRFVIAGAMKDKKIYELFNSISGLKAEFIDSLGWADDETVPKIIQSFDVGVMPLVENEWNKSKCAFKAVEYMACGVIPVISPVGENLHLIKNGVSGFLPESAEDWARDIIDIYERKADIDSISMSAIKTVKDRYSAEVLSSKLLEVVGKKSNEKHKLQSLRTG